MIAALPSLANAFEFKITTNNLETDLRDTSLLTPLADAGSDATTQDVVAAAQADYARLVGLMYDRGFFAPQVSILIDGKEAAALSPVQPLRQIDVVELKVVTGKSFRFGTAKIAPLAPNTTLPAEFVKGGDASTRVIQEMVLTSIDSWRDVGHAKADLRSQSITARHDTARLDTDIRIQPGPLLRFGDLRVKGNKRMRTQRIVEIAGLPKGDVFNPDEVSRAAARLRRSGVFAVVSLSEAEKISPNDTLDIQGQFTESKLRKFGFGAELSTQDGLGLSGYWLHRNLRGGGERLRIGAEIKGIGGETAGNDYEVTLAFSRPATFGSDTDASRARSPSSIRRVRNSRAASAETSSGSPSRAG